MRDGGVYIGRSRVEDPARRLHAGERITVHEARGVDVGVEIAYRDADVLVVEKPAGIPTQATRERSRGALDREVQRGEPSARLFHRLDRDASGLVLFTRSVEAQRRFSEWLAAGLVERRYAAVVWGHMRPDEGILDRPIGPDPSDRRRMTAGLGRPALTRFRVMKRGSIEGAPTTLLELDLVTGRTHQIRVHLSDAGYPLCGDRLYGLGEASTEGGESVVLADGESSPAPVGESGRAHVGESGRPPLSADGESGRAPSEMSESGRAPVGASGRAASEMGEPGRASDGESGRAHVGDSGTVETTAESGRASAGAVAQPGQSRSRPRPTGEPGRARRLCLHSCRLAWPGAEPVVSPVPDSFRDLVDAE